VATNPAPPFTDTDVPSINFPAEDQDEAIIIHDEHSDEEFFIE
jgi:hypothetical protein